MAPGPAEFSGNYSLYSVHLLRASTTDCEGSISDSCCRIPMRTVFASRLLCQQAVPRRHSTCLFARAALLSSPLPSDRTRASPSRVFCSVQSPSTSAEASATSFPPATERHVHGHLHLIIGPMFAGKTTELLRLILHHEACGLACHFAGVAAHTSAFCRRRGGTSVSSSQARITASLRLRL